jgi:hypothetical protein
MRVRGFENLASALAEKAKQAQMTPEKARSALPVPYTGRKRPVRVLSAEETAENRRFLLIQQGLCYYEEVWTSKQREPDPTRVYLGPRFAPPKAKPNHGCRY